MLSVKGIYSNGQIKILDQVPDLENVDVIITFLDKKANPSVSHTFDDAQFWNLLSKLDWDADLQDDVVKPVVKGLSEMAIGDIYQFEEILAEKLYHLDSEAIAKNIGQDSYKDDDYFSNDVFLYSRCYIVACGQEYYYQVLQNPATIVKDKEFDPLLYISQKAYEIKTSRDDFSLLTRFSYETYSNKEGWNLKNGFMDLVKGLPNE
ncbi:MAG: DUF4240 domain-containing protein [Spirochaetota bacterium]